LSDQFILTERAQSMLETRMLSWQKALELMFSWQF